MVIHSGCGQVRRFKESSETEDLKAKIAMDTLLLQIEEDHGFRRVLERIEELKKNLYDNKKKLAQIENDEIIDKKNTRCKPYKWNWR